MSKVFKKLKLQQTEKSLEKWRNTALSLTPKQGWLRTLRTSLGMTQDVLSKRLDISSVSVGKLEKSEANGTITLNSLRRAAEALDCELKYALVPRVPLNEIKKKQAKIKAQELMRSSSHSMKLEAQEVDELSQQFIMDELVKDLLEGSDKELWK